MSSGPRDSQSINRLCRVYTGMLCAYPKAFRIRFGREMQQVFRDKCRAAATSKDLSRFLLLVFWDWLRTSFRERLAVSRGLEIPGKGWWLLALCGIIDAICGGMHLLIAAGLITLRRVPPNIVVWVRDICVLAVVAGVCAITAGLWNSGRGNSWLLSLHGLALGAFGLIGISPLVRGPLSFRPISLLFVLMAVSVGAFALGIDQKPRGSAPDRWLLRIHGVASVGFACSFLVVGQGWVRLRPPAAYWIWMGSYFGVTAFCMLSMAVRLHRTGPSLPEEESTSPT
jgi:uncharacterized membrane protein HdeD (DUF308 family)